MDMMDTGDDTVTTDMDISTDGQLFEVILLDGTVDSVVFTFIHVDMENTGSGEKGQGQENTLTELRNLINACGGVEIAENVENYGYEIPIIMIPSNDEGIDLKVWQSKLVQLLKSRKMRDIFTASFITDSIRLKRKLDLNEYRFMSSEFETYDANDVMNLKLKWSDLTPKNNGLSNCDGSSASYDQLLKLYAHLLVEHLRLKMKTNPVVLRNVVLMSKPRPIRNQVTDSGSGLFNISTPQKSPRKFKFRPIVTRSSGLGKSVQGNQDHEDSEDVLVSPIASARKIDSVSKEIQVSAKRRADSPSTSTSGLQQPRKKIVAPAVSPVQLSSHTESESDDSIGDMQIYSDEDVGRNSQSSFNQESKRSTSASVRKESSRLNSDSSSSSNKSTATYPVPPGIESESPQVPSGARQPLSVQGSSTSGLQQPRLEIIAPPVSPIHSSSEAEADSDGSRIHLYTDDDKSERSQSSLNRESQRSTSASVRKESDRGRSNSMSSSRSPAPTSSVPSRVTNAINLVPAQIRRQPIGKTFMKKTEMQTVLDFICNEDLFSMSGGNDVWKIIEKRKIVANRTWQTLRNNFRRSILPQGKLETFSVSKIHYDILCRLRTPTMMEN